MKNRMREIRTSGSVRGGDGNIPAYSARGLDDRASFAIGLVELAEPGIGVGLHQSGIPGQMLLRMLTATIRRVEEHGRWRIWPGKRAVVAHIGPEGGRHCGVVGVDAFGRKDMAPDRVNQRHQGCGGAAHPICQRRDIEVDAFTLVDVALTIERAGAGRTWRTGHEPAAWALHARAQSGAREPAAG